MLDGYYAEFIHYVTNVEKWIFLGKTVLKIIIILLAARIVVSIATVAINRIFQQREGGKFQRIQLDGRRSGTMRTLVTNLIKYTVYFIAFYNVFTFLGFDPGPLLASAGVLGLAIGFGAQNLIRDIITGFFIIFEDQFAVGDVVTIKGVTGTVQEIGLRITRIKTWTGEVHILPNGSISEVTNLSVENSMAVVDVSVSYDADINFVLRTLEEMTLVWEREMEDIVRTPTVLGVERFGSSDIVIRIIAECKPLTHQSVMRKIRADIKKAFDEKGIEIPYPRMVMIPQNDGTGPGESVAAKQRDQ
ncbi:mechanosensitive ion channel family protein [Aneurinibacillus terranovensis]|uniref:mechanosensitive ion channel family protein n=1 Tax=Aneurinibacillus terranovensis TaxID=278991 RepID=UPI0006849AA9|nr:mechanosensitive ion channel family protein [Aneurinibacillus terranovensis]